MAKAILRLFGGASILIGLLTIVVGLLTPNGAGLIITVPIGAGFLISGAPLLGFAQVIALLEQIARNTAAGYQGASLQGAIAVAGSGAALHPTGGDPAYAPRQGDHSMTMVVERGNYRGQDYRHHANDAVTARLADGPYTWQTFDAFRDWVDSRTGV